jgi:extracellular elastinolytic metalloproteinase
MYKTLDTPGYWGVHAIGEVWAEMLWVVAQKLIDRHGYVADLFPPPVVEEEGEDDGTSFYRPRVRDPITRRLGPQVPRHGNSLVMQLVINAMKLQPCRPSFFEARDAILQADQVLTGGENFCDIWSAFAGRGLGLDAKVEGKTPWGGGIRTNVSVVFFWVKG